MSSSERLVVPAKISSRRFTALPAREPRSVASAGVSEGALGAVNTCEVDEEVHRFAAG